MATAEPFLYMLSATATEGTALDRLEAALLEALERVRRDGVTPAEVARAKAQLHARLVFDNDSVTNIAHQLGYFDIVTGPGYFDELKARVARVTAAEVSDVARRRLLP